MISDYLDLFDEEMYVYCSFSSKVELLVDRLFSQYQNQPCFNADLMKYSLAKLLVLYRPNEVDRNGSIQIDFGSYGPRDATG